MSCQSWYFQHSTTGERILYNCNSVRCGEPGCVQAWTRKRMAILNALIKEHSLTRFFTLTIDRSHSCREAWNQISTWWNKFRHKLKYHMSKFKDIPGYYPKVFKFVAVLEAHKDGYPHIHGFWNIWIPEKVLSSIWSKAAPGYMVEVSQIDDSKSASEYLTTEMGKYLGKAQSIQGARMAGHRQRTMWRSKGLYTKYELDRHEPGLYNGDWTLVKEDYYGSEERKGTDLEGTCRPVPEESPTGSGAEVDSAEGEGEAMQRPRHMCRQTQQPQHRDKEAPRSGSEDTEKEVTYEKVWSREHSLYTGQSETG